MCEKNHKKYSSADNVMMFVQGNGGTISKIVTVGMEKL